MTSFASSVAWLRHGVRLHMLLLMLLLLLLLLLLLPNTNAACVSVEPGANLALGKVATQQTTSTSDVAGKAVDGLHGMCTSGYSQTLATTFQVWWSVDLGFITWVASVLLYNFGNGTPTIADYYTKRVNIGVSDFAPSGSVNPASYQLCYHNIEVNYRSVTHFVCINGPIRGRWVIFQVIGAPDHAIILCEVEVYGPQAVTDSTVQGYYETMRGAIYSVDEITTYPARSRLQCMQHCNVMLECMSASYDRGQCTLHCSQTTDPNDANIVATPSATYIYNPTM